MAFRNEVWKAEGVSTFSLGVLARGHGIHIKENSETKQSKTKLYLVQYVDSKIKMKVKVKNTK